MPKAKIRRNILPIIFQLNLGFKKHKALLFFFCQMHVENAPASLLLKYLKKVSHHCMPHP